MAAKLNRRHFIGHSCKLGMASTALSGSLLNLAMTRQVAAAGGAFPDYRAMVCVLLAGGNDSYNMLVPSDDDQHAQYANLRSDLAIPKAELLNLATTANNGRQYGLHPGMAEVQQLYGNNELAVLSSVGTLLEPVTTSNFDTAGTRLPLGLFSHSDQIAQWQTAVADDRLAQGWGGRIGDLLQNANANNGISMSISLGGSNVFQSGRQTVEYAISPQGDGAEGVANYNDGTEFGDARKSWIDQLLAIPNNNLLRREYVRRLRSTIDSREVFVDALQASAGPSTSFSASPFSQSLRQIARVIGARDELGACRQTFFVLVGGWDHHDDVLENQAAMLPAISQGLLEFRNALVDLGVFNNVTTFTTSDFGRTLTSNGKGSDHGWSGHHLVMGGSVAGGQMYGTYPTLEPNSPLDVGRGVYVPTTSVDEYFAELALWFGVQPGDLDQVLPNVGNFYTPGSGAPLGFLL